MAGPRYNPIGPPVEMFLQALHSSHSIDAVQTTCAAYAGKLIPSDAYGWYLFNRHTVEPTVVSARGVTDNFLTLYEREGRCRDPLFQGLLREHRAICSDFDLDVGKQQAFGFQVEISSGTIARAVEAPLVVAGEIVGTLNVARGPGSPRFTRGEAEGVAMIARHASIALARARRETELQTRCTVMESSLDVLELPLVVTGPDHEILFANFSARRLLDRRRTAIMSALRTTVDMLADSGQHVATAHVSRDTTYTKGCAKGYTNGCAKGYTKGSGQQLTPVDGTVLVVRSARHDRFGAVVSFFYETSAKIDRPVPVLSRREREITDFVVRGLSNAQIATAAAISRNTVKQHLKHVFEKLKVGSRAELAAVIAGDRAVADAEAAYARRAATFRDDQSEAPFSDAVVPSRPPRRP